MTPRPSLAHAKEKARRREPIPDAIREEVISFGKLLAELFPAFAGNSRLKFTVARLFLAQLPPLPRPPGRPGYAQVTRAIRLGEEIRQTHPERTSKAIWAEVYERVIPRYADLTVIERRAAQDQLRRQVHWRLSARRRYRRQRAAQGDPA